jgi:hypothetical protein
VSENPWTHLPPSPPFVLPDDEPFVRDFNNRAAPKAFLHINEILPEPFVGAPDAPVVLLSNNPGLGKGATQKQAGDFMDRMRDNLRHAPSDYPFVYLAPDFTGPHKQWWERKLKSLLKRFGHQVVARSILNVPYFPYASQRFGRGLPRLPSQAYSFRLVRHALVRNAIIVFMRRDAMWKEALPELEKYDRIFR